MSKGVEFYFKRNDKQRVVPPFNASGQLVFGFSAADRTVSLIVAFMHDFYAVGAEEQREMALNTIALCELKYNQQEIDHV